MSEQEPFDLSQTLADFRHAVASGSSTSTLLKTGERREVVVLFLDIVGFSTLTEKLNDPERVYTIISGLFSAFSKIIQHHGGRVEKFIGDAIMAAWSTEQITEFDAEKAVTAGFEILDALTQMNMVLKEVGIELNARIGINAGLVVFIPDPSNPNGWSITGDTVNSAQRLESNAQPGTILVSASVRESAGEAFLYEDKGEMTVKGKTIPIHTFAITGKGSGRKKPWERVELVQRSAMVGRETQLQKLNDLLHQSVELNWRGNAKHQLVGIKGEPGLGKSRLVHEFITQSNATVLKGQTLAFAQPPLWVWTSLLRDFFGIAENDSKAREKLDHGIANFLAELPESDGTELRERLALFYHLLAISSEDESINRLNNETKNSESKLAVKILLQTLARHHRLIILLEDTHWLDSSSERWLNFLLENCETDNPILFLCTYRPEGTLPIVHESYADSTEIELHPITSEDSRQLIQVMLSGNLPESAESFIVERSDGNPFFVEEVLLSLIARGIIQKSENGWVLLRPLTESEVPLTLNAMVLSRIDQLEPILKEVVRRASVIGREFFLDTLRRINRKLGDIENTEVYVEELERFALLLESTESAELAYLFKHAVTRDVAYSTILHQNRRVFHRIAAEVMEELYRDTDYFSAMILDHWLKAESDIEKISHWGLRAIGFCHIRQQLREGVEWCVKILERLQQQPASQALDETIFKLQEYICIFSSGLGKFEEVANALRAMKQLVERYNWTEQAWSMVIQESYYYILQGDANKGFGVLQAAFDTTPLPKNREQLANVMNIKGTALIQKNAYAEAEKSLATVLEVANETQDNYLKMKYYNNIGLIRMNQGECFEAIQYFQTAISTGKDNRIVINPLILTNHCEALLQAGRIEEAEQGLKEAVGVARNGGTKLCEADGQKLLGQIAFNKEQWDWALTHYQDAATLYKETEATGDYAATRCLIGLTHLRRNDGKAGKQVLEEIDDLSKASPGLVIGPDYFNLSIEMDVFEQNYDAALSKFKTMLDEYLEQGSFVFYVTEALHATTIELEIHRVEDAIKRYRDAVTLYEEKHIQRNPRIDFSAVREKMISAGIAGERVPLPVGWTN